MRRNTITFLVAVIGAAILFYMLGHAEGERKGLSMVDRVDRSSFWQGRYEQCIVDGFSEETCFSMIDSLRQQEKP